MSQLIKPANYNNTELILSFEGAQDIFFPFDGTLIISPINSNSQITDEGIYHWLFTSFLLPIRNPGQGNISNLRQGKKFQPLRGFDNQIFTFGEKTILFFIANDPVYDNSESKKAHECVSALPWVVAIELDKIDINRQQLGPLTKQKGVPVKNCITDFPSSNLCGNIYAFDFAGMQIDTYSALNALSIEPLGLSQELLVQFVNLHGSPCKNLQNILYDNKSIDPEFSRADVQILEPKANSLFKIPNFTQPQICFEFTHPSAQVCAWPQGSLEKQNQSVAFRLEKPATNLVECRRFLRICVFNPEDEFQTKAGGVIDTATNRFDKNNFRVFTTNNYVKVFNNGQPFFKDFYEQVGELSGSGQLLLTNWTAHPHSYLTGSLDLYRVAKTGKESQEVHDGLEKLKETGYLVKVEDTDTQVFFPQQSNVFSGKLKVKTAEGVVQEGFCQEGYTTFLRLKNIQQVVNCIQAQWKNDKGQANYQEVNIGPFDTAGREVNVATQFAATWFELGIGDQDPPEAILKIKVAAEDIETAIGKKVNEVQLLILNVTAGWLVLKMLSAEIILSSLTAQDNLLVALVNASASPDSFSREDFITGFREFKYSDEQNRLGMIPYHEKELGGLLRQAIAKGVEVKALFWDNMLFRLKNEIKSSTSTQKDMSGNANNQAIANCINRVVNGKSGGAVVDRSARALGSFHQKASVLVEKKGNSPSQITAYVGGMDLGIGRWDTQYHFHEDPDRQAGFWHDVQVKICGDAAEDVFKNFQQRWNVLKKLKDKQDSKGIPELGVDRLNQILELPQTTSKAVVNNAFVQINRTIPGKSMHANISGAYTDNGSEKIYVDETGELGARASYLLAIQNARKFIHIEDQYFFDLELALELHNALAREDGPEFLILVLPKVLDEMGAIDNLLYKLRNVAIEIVKYGVEDQPVIGLKPKNKMVPANSQNCNKDVSSKIVVCTSINDLGKAVYVHSKHMIVDDLWMTIGSSNMGYRSMTYDFEIDAAIIGNKLYKGGTEVVRNQRVEIWRQLLNLPVAMSPILQDPYAGFKLFKRIAGQEAANVPDTNLLPFKKAHVKGLDLSNFPKIGESGTVVSLTPEDDEFWWLIGLVADPDGRVLEESNYLSSLFKYPPQEFVKVTLDFAGPTGNSCVTELRKYLDAQIGVEIQVSVTREDSATALLFETLPIKSEGNNEITIEGPAVLFVPFAGKSTIQAKVFRKSPGDSLPVELPYGGQVTVSETWSKPFQESKISIG